jgi:hypothetical protein
MSQVQDNLMRIVEYPAVILVAVERIVPETQTLSDSFPPLHL